jgi:hypothetical protein
MSRPFGGWPIVPRGTSVLFRHNFNSRGCRTLCVFPFCKGCGFRSHTHRPSLRTPLTCHPDRGRLSADEGPAFAVLTAISISRCYFMNSRTMNAISSAAVSSAK